MDRLSHFTKCQVEASSFTLYLSSFDICYNHSYYLFAKHFSLPLPFDTGVTSDLELKMKRPPEQTLQIIAKNSSFYENDFQPWRTYPLLLYCSIVIYGHAIAVALAPCAHALRVVEADSFFHRGSSDFWKCWASDTKFSTLALFDERYKMVCV